MGLITCSNAFKCGHNTSVARAGHCTRDSCANSVYNCVKHGKPVRRPL